MAKAQWHRVENVREFLASQGRRDVGRHTPAHRKCFHWPICSRCGLVYLRNEPTRKALREPCVVIED